MSPVRVTGDTNAEEIGRWMAGLFGGREEGAAPSPEEPAHV
jgi:simple sugar transport system ATP-binding protein